MKGLSSFSLWVRYRKEDTGQGAEEKSSFVIKCAYHNWVILRELGSLGKGSRDSFLCFLRMAHSRCEGEQSTVMYIGGRGT